MELKGQNKSEIISDQKKGLDSSGFPLSQKRICTGEGILSEISTKVALHPAKCHENLKLECSGSEQPPNIPSTETSCGETEATTCFSFRD